MQRSASAIPNTVLWGGAASALLGATLAEWQRRREEEAARLAAMRNSGGGGDEEEEQGNGRKSAGQIAYEKKQQHKRIVAESQALMNHRKAQEQTQNAIAKNKNLAQAEAEMDKVTPYVAASYIDKDEEKWLREKESQQAWAAVNAQEEAKQEHLNEVYAERWAGVASVAQGKQVKEDSPSHPIYANKKTSHLFYNAYGQHLIERAIEDEILRAPDIAAMKTYIAAAINVQRASLNTDHKGPAQLSETELRTEYGEPYFNKEKDKIQGYGLGLPGANPYDPEIAVKGMNNRVKQVLEYAENQSEKKGVNLSSTDKFIIVALAQNGGGFDLNDIQDAMRPRYIENGQIDWDAYFDLRQNGWENRVEEAWKNPFILDNAKTLFYNYFRTGGDDYNTQFMLEEFYKKSLELQSKGYYLPEDLDTDQIEALIRPSMGAEVGQ